MSETKKIFNVKDSSSNEFFSRYAVEKENSNIHRDDMNPYYYMKDELILLETAFPKDEIDIVVFELQDIARGSGRTLINTYVYSVRPYDDVSIKLKLEDFKIKLEEKNIIL